MYLNLNFSLGHPRLSLLWPHLVVQQLLVQLPEQLPAEVPKNQEVSELITTYKSSRRRLTCN